MCKRGTAILGMLILVGFSSRAVRADMIEVTTESGYNDGLSARSLTSVTTQNFDSAVSGTTIPNGTSLGGAFTLSGFPALTGVVSSFATTSGSNYLAITSTPPFGFSSEFSTGGFTFSFAPTNAFSMKIITSTKGVLSNDDFTLQTAFQSVNLNVADATVIAGGGTPFSTEAYFFGVINTDSTFTSATFNKNNGDTILYHIDDLTTAIPEPGSLAILLLTGTALVNFRRSRRR